MSARIVEVIYVDSELAGEGTNMDDPIRRLEQFFTKDGQLICQYDSCLHFRNEMDGNRGTFFAIPPSAALGKP